MNHLNTDYGTKCSWFHHSAVLSCNRTIQTFHLDPGQKHCHDHVMKDSKQIKTGRIILNIKFQFPMFPQYYVNFFSFNIR